MDFIRIAFFIIGLAGLPLAAIAEEPLFDADQFGEINLEFKQDSSSTRNLESVLNGSPKFELLAQYSENDPLRQLGRAVGRLDLHYARRGVVTCTASIISRDYILTNYHCVPGTDENRPIADALLVMDYYSKVNTSNVRRYVVGTTPVEADKKLDYAILRVSGNPSALFGTVKILDWDPNPRASLLMIHHPLGRPKHVTRTGCRVAAEFRPDTNDLFHSCDTLPGSSGAPVFLSGAGGALGLHYGGLGPLAPGNYNSATRMRAMLEKSELLRSLAETAPAPSSQQSTSSKSYDVIDMEEETTMYIRVRRVAVYDEPDKGSNTQGTLESGEAVLVTGRVDEGPRGQAWYQVIGPEGEIGYVLQSTLTEQAPAGSQPNQTATSPTTNARSQRPVGETFRDCPAPL